MTAEELETGYWRAYRDFYRWGSILRGAWTKDTLAGRLRHAAYAAGWKKFEPLWGAVIKAKRVFQMLPVLEAVLEGIGPEPRDRRTSRAGGGSDPTGHAPALSFPPGGRASARWRYHVDGRATETGSADSSRVSAASE